MEPNQFKKIARNLKVYYAELEKEALKAGVPITSPKFDQAAKRVRTLFLEREGFTDDEYEEAKAIIEDDRKKPLIQAVADEGDISRYIETL